MQKKIKRIIEIIVIVFVVFTAIAFWIYVGYNFTEKEDNVSDKNCFIENKIATININGYITGYTLKATDGTAPQDEVSADNVVVCINKLAKNKNVKASGAWLSLDIKVLLIETRTSQP